MKRAFTLIELLVVIAIIAILAAILFPVFAQAKAAAKKTSALSNSKQLTLGVIMYMNDDDDVYPQGSGNCWWYPTDGGWSWDTQPYIKSAAVFADSSDNNKYAWQGTTWWPKSSITVSFASNGLLAWDNTINGGAGSESLFGLMGMNQSSQNAVNTRCGTGWFAGRGITVASAVTQPAGTVMLAERLGGDDIFGQGDLMSGVNWWDNVGAGLLPDGTRTLAANGGPYTAPNSWANPSVPYTVNADPRNGAIATIYSNSAPMTFADGHAKAMVPYAANPDPTNRPADNLFNAYR
jgi:prepilin-type N-terminal cleavage/methylation domain-containing protein/prepilin-type processing-associated H-X9-DG protein